MSRKNFKVATAENGKTPTQNKKHMFVTTKKDNTPTGKVKTIADKAKIREERERQYRDFRINALKRRAKRIGLSEEQTNVKIEELKKQLDTPNSYNVLVLFNANDKDLVKQAMMNEGLAYSIMADTYLYTEADAETLATMREIMPPGAKIHPYVKKKPPILPTPTSAAKKKKPITKAKKKALATEAKKKRKAAASKAHFDKKEHAKQRKEVANKKNRKQQKSYELAKKRAQKASKKKPSTVVKTKAKSPSNATKKASTTMIPRRKMKNAA